MLTFQRWEYEVEGKPGLVHIDPGAVVTVTEETRNPRPGAYTEPQVRVAVIHLKMGGDWTMRYEVLDEKRDAAQRIVEARQGSQEKANAQTHLHHSRL